MKKIITLLLTLCLIFSLCACSLGQKAAAEYKLGMGIVSAVSGSDEEAVVNATVAAVVLDKDGKIADCKLDAIQNSVEIEGGKIDRDDADDFETKQEDGNDYGMKEYSSIKKEWFEQADHFAQYVVGMTAGQVSAIATKDSGGNQVATDQLIVAGCTIGVADFIKAIVAACEDSYAKTFNAGEFKLGLGVNSALDSSSKDADDGEGSLKIESDIAAAVTDKSGKILALSLDVIVPEIKFDKNGAVLNAADAVVSKKAAGDNYGMKQYSPIGKEWYEQAVAFEDYVVGLDATGVNSIQTGTDGKTTDNILKAGCTVAVTGYMKAAEKAARNAK